MKPKIIVLLVSCIALILAACTETPELRIVHDDELSGELLVALSYFDTGRTIKLGPYDPTQRTSYLPIHDKMMRFMNKHPKVTIKILDVEWMTAYDKGIRSYAPPNFIYHVPDIIELTPHQARWMMREELEELTFYYENYPLDNKWPEEYSYLNELAMVDGMQYLLPISTNPMIVFYSAPIFKTLGIDPPEDDWTWDDFLSIARRVKDAGYINGVFYTTTNTEMNITVDNIEHFIVAHGGRYISSDQSKFAGYLDSDPTRHAFDLYLDVFEPLFESDHLWSAKANSAYRKKYPTFGMGRASRLFSILDVIEPLEKDPTNNRGYELLPMPLTDDDHTVNTSLVTGLGITKGSQQKELAWEFMKFIVSDESDGIDPMHLVTDNTLAAVENRFIIRQPEQYNRLVELMQLETTNSIVSSLHFVPHYISSSIYDATGDLDRVSRQWDLDREQSIHGQLERIRDSVEDMRDEMIEHGFRVPWWGDTGL